MYSVSASSPLISHVNRSPFVITMTSVLLRAKSAGAPSETNSNSQHILVFIPVPFLVTRRKNRNDLNRSIRLAFDCTRRILALIGAETAKLLLAQLFERSAQWSAGNFDQSPIRSI